MLDLAEQAMKVLGVLTGDRLADPAELQGAQGVALLRVRSVGGADLLEDYLAHQELDSSSAGVLVSAGSPLASDSAWAATSASCSASAIASAGVSATTATGSGAFSS